MPGKRHKWELVRREYGYTARRCVQCGLVRISRHAYNQHWSEYMRAGQQLKVDKLPPCEIPGAAAVLEPEAAI